MESRAFIRNANQLIKKIETFKNEPADRAKSGEALQKEINQLFAGLQNPTLMTAAQLAREATSAGFEVRPEIMHRLKQAEACWE